jgi:hypothetical protein
MHNEKNYPLHSHYVLLNNHTKKPFYITLNGKTYTFIASRQYFLKSKKDFFSIKEKLYILNLSSDVIWSPISTPHRLYKTLFCNAISPLNLEINIIKGKVIPYVSKKGVL